MKEIKNTYPNYFFYTPQEELRIFFSFFSIVARSLAIDVQYILGLSFFT